MRLHACIEQAAAPSQRVDPEIGTQNIKRAKEKLSTVSPEEREKILGRDFLSLPIEKKVVDGERLNWWGMRNILHHEKLFRYLLLVT